MLIFRRCFWLPLTHPYAPQPPDGDHRFRAKTSTLEAESTADIRPQQDLDAAKPPICGTARANSLK